MQTPLDALASELGLVAGRIEREAGLRITAALAELRVADLERDAKFAALEKRISDTLALVKDGQPGPAGSSVTIDDVAPLIKAEVGRAVSELPPAEDGKDADPELISRMVQEEVAKLPPAEPGKDADPVLVAELVDKAVAALPPAEPGRSVTVEEVAPLIEEAVARQIALLPPAEPGKSVTVDDLRPVLQGMVDALPPAEPGRSLTIDDVAPLVEKEVARQVAALPPAEPGKSVNLEDVAPLIKDEISKQVGALPPAEPGRSVTVEDVAPLIEDVVSRHVAALPPAEPGKPGPTGKLPTIKVWEDRVHYEGEVVVLDGSTYQASKDTGRAPPHDDWACIAAGGKNGADGRTSRVRGTYEDGAEYQELDIVALNGASFIAKRNDPGPCPGEGWQLSAAQGKRGNAGDKGPKGERGMAGPAVTALDVDSEGLMVLKNSDGSEVECDLYPVLSKV